MAISIRPHIKSPSKWSTACNLSSAARNNKEQQKAQRKAEIKHLA